MNIFNRLTIKYAAADWILSCLMEFDDLSEQKNVLIIHELEIENTYSKAQLINPGVHLTLNRWYSCKAYSTTEYIRKKSCSSTMPRTSTSTSRVLLLESASLTHSHNTQTTPNFPTRTTWSAQCGMMSLLTDSRLAMASFTSLSSSTQTTRRFNLLL